ncbi:hypothetical protein Tsp_04128 [Trichinella spiralis]|uniref:hypothetical protein n=1 Tax=Trichinella spiralis TaxID=6334 RepID=UPI0001EFB757|nr:hypothetical protein Tsp_04128 [Trichinella spiralis]
MRAEMFTVQSINRWNRSIIIYIVVHQRTCKKTAPAILSNIWPHLAWDRSLVCRISCRYSQFPVKLVNCVYMDRLAMAKRWHKKVEANGTVVGNLGTTNDSSS